MDFTFANCLFTKICVPKSILVPSSPFTDMHMHRAVNKFQSSNKYVCSQLRLNKVMLCFLLSVLMLSKVSFFYLVQCFSHLCLLLISLLKMALKHNVEVLSTVPEYKSPMRYVMENIGITLLFTVSSMLMNRQYILHTVLFNRNTHKTRLDTDRLMLIL